MRCEGLGSQLAEAAKEVGVRMTAAAEVRKRKFDGDGGDQLSSYCSSSSSSLVQLKRRLSIAAENSNDPCVSPSSDHHQASSSSCSSSNASSNLAEEKKFVAVDGQEGSSVEIATSAATYNVEHIERETTPLSELQAESAELESKSAWPPEACSRRGSTPAVKMPSDASEIEDFLSAAEKSLQKHFSEKYNFDFAKEEAMEGRFTWTASSYNYKWYP